MKFNLKEAKACLSEEVGLRRYGRVGRGGYYCPVAESGGGEEGRRLTFPELAKFGSQEQGGVRGTG